MIGKYLSEVIDYQRDIEPYRIIQIYSGVGSGKNHWVKTLAEQGFNILLITSRKSLLMHKLIKWKRSAGFN